MATKLLTPSWAKDEAVRLVKEHLITSQLQLMAPRDWGNNGQSLIVRLPKPIKR